MRHFYLPLIFLLCYCSISTAQSSLQFTINQPSLLIVDAGKDTIVNKGSKIKLGGEVPANGGSGSYTYSWSPVTGLDNAAIANPIATIDSNIIYTLSVNDGKGCIKTSQVNLTIADATGVEPTVDSLGLRIFPNPSTGVLFIKSAGIINESSLLVEIFDMLGRKVYSASIPGNQRINQTIGLEPYPKGFYYLKLSGAKFNTTFKILIQ